MNITRRALIAALGPLASTALVPATAAEALKPVTIAMAIDGFQFTPLYVARANGYFQAEGLDVTLLPSGGGAKAMTTVLTGAAQVLAAVASEVINADNHGQKVLIFAALLERPVSSIVVQQEVALKYGVTLQSPLPQRLAALRGLKIGISSVRSASDAITRVLLMGGGIDPTREVELVPTGGGANQVAAFMAHKVDAVSTSSPSTEELLLRGRGVELFDISKGDNPIYRRYPWTVVSANRAWLEGNPQTVAGLVRAFAKAQRFVHDDPEGTAKILRGVFPRIDPAAFDAACQRTFQAVAANPSVSVDAIASSFDEFRRLSTEKLVVTPEQITTNAYVEAALGKPAR